MKSSLAFFVVLASLLSLGANAQTADEILNKHIQAIGGPEVLSKIKSAVIEGDVEVGGNSIPTTTTILYGKGAKSVTSFNGTDIIQCFTDTSGWVLNPMTGQTQAEAMTPAQARLGRASLEIGGPVYGYKDKGYTAEYLGTEKLGDVNTYKVKLTRPNEVEMTLYFDSGTYYMVREDSRILDSSQDMTNSSTFSDFRKTDAGYVMPFVTNTSAMGYDIAINISKVEFNKEIDPSFFEMPK